jgi:hypothetical protein
VSNGFLIFGNDGTAFGEQGVENTGTDGVNTGEQAVTGGGAGAGSGVGVAEAEAFFSELFDMRSSDFGLRVGDTAVTIAEVIGENEDDVGGRACASFGRPR